MAKVFPTKKSKVMLLSAIRHSRNCCLELCKIRDVTFLEGGTNVGDRGCGGRVFTGFFGACKRRHIMHHGVGVRDSLVLRGGWLLASSLRLRFVGLMLTR